MTSFRRWKSGTAGLMAIAITTGTVAPLFAPVSANAQVFKNQGQYPNQNSYPYPNQGPDQYPNRYPYESRTVSIPAGVRIPLVHDKQKVIVTPDETASLTLKVPRNIVDRSGRVLIPENSEVIGQLQPATIRGQKGSYFVAQELKLPNGQRQAINATSPIVTRRENITRGANTGTILKDAAIGAGAASVISLLTGNRRIETLEPIIGAGAGAVASILLRKREADVVVIYPEQGELDVTLRSNLLVSTNRSY